MDGVSFELHKGETLAIVGESGSGKTVANLSILKLIPSPPGKIVGGKIYMNNEDLLKKNPKEIQRLRGNKISMIFQDPMTSLNPFLKISTQIIETLTFHQKLNKKDARIKAIEMLKLVGIPKPELRIDNYPHQFSGGMRQRVMIAIGLCCNPEILIADEPTSCLDVTIQAQILEIIKELTLKLQTAVIMITHNLGVVAGMCNNVCVMYAGKIVEKGTVDQLLLDSKHPYTKGLIRSIPRLDKPENKRLYSIKGQPPNLINLPECCTFHPRCENVMDICKKKYPPTFKIKDNWEVNCWLYKKGDKSE